MSSLKKKKKSKVIKWLFLVVGSVIAPLMLLVVAILPFLQAPVPNLPKDMFGIYKEYANLINGDWELIAAYDLAIHHNNPELLNPEKAAWDFFILESDGNVYVGENQIHGYLGNWEDDLTTTVDYLNHEFKFRGHRVTIQAKGIVSLESTLPDDIYKWIEQIVSSGCLAVKAGDTTWKNINTGKLAYENKGFFAMPLPVGTYKISSRGFGYRIHPIFKTKKFHSGQDLTAPEGTPVGAAADGVAKTLKDPNGYGNYIKVFHSNGFITVYAHLASFNVDNNQKVSKGTCIGFVGSTGASTGPHLHFEVRKDNQFLDPMKFLK